MKICNICKEPKFNFQMKRVIRDNIIFVSDILYKICKRCFKEELRKKESEILKKYYDL